MRTASSIFSSAPLVAFLSETAPVLSQEAIDTRIAARGSRPHRSHSTTKTTKNSSSALSLALLISSLCAAAPAMAQEDRSAPPLVKQINDGNWLSQSEAEAMRDELYYQRAVHTYMTMLPALNTIGMKDGSEAIFGKGYNVLPIWKERMDARTWVPTPNADVIYSMSYLDLKEAGPLVVAAPPNVIGMFTDFFQRTLTDVGAIGPDRARGGLYLPVASGL
jgi:hypothetical protein